MSATDSSQDVLAEVLTLSRAMHDAAGRNDWEALAELEAKRAPLVSVELPHGEHTREVLAEVLKLDSVIRQAVSSARDSIAGEWRASQHAHRALRSYTDR